MESDDSFECAHESDKIVVCGIDGTVEFEVWATTNDRATLVQGIEVKIGETPVTPIPGEPSNPGGPLPYHFKFTIPAETIGAGSYEITITDDPNKNITVHPPAKRNLAIIHCQIDGHDGPVWCGAGDEGAVTLTACDVSHSVTPRIPPWVD